MRGISFDVFSQPSVQFCFLEAVSLADRGPLTLPFPLFFNLISLHSALTVRITFDDNTVGDFTSDFRTLLSVSAGSSLASIQGTSVFTISQPLAGAVTIQVSFTPSFITLTPLLARVTPP